MVNEIIYNIYIFIIGVYILYILYRCCDCPATGDTTTNSAASTGRLEPIPLFGPRFLEGSFLRHRPLLGLSVGWTSPLATSWNSWMAKVIQLTELSLSMKITSRASNAPSQLQRRRPPQITGINYHHYYY